MKITIIPKPVETSACRVLHCRELIEYDAKEIKITENEIIIIL